MLSHSSPGFFLGHVTVGFSSLLTFSCPIHQPSALSVTFSLAFIDLVTPEARLVWINLFIKSVERVGRDREICKQALCNSHACTHIHTHTFVEGRLSPQTGSNAEVGKVWMDSEYRWFGYIGNLPLYHVSLL